VVVCHRRVRYRPAIEHNRGIGTDSNEGVREHDAIGPRGRPAGSYKAALPLVWGKSLSDRSAVDADVKAARPETFAKQELEFVGGADLQFGKGDSYSAVILVIRGIAGITPADATQDRTKDHLFRGITEV